MILIKTGMKKIFFLIAVNILFVAGCNSKSSETKDGFTLNEVINQNSNQTTNQMEDIQKKENPYYSRTDTAKLTFRIQNGKKFYLKKYMT